MEEWALILLLTTAWCPGRTLVTTNCCPFRCKFFIPFIYLLAVGPYKEESTEDPYSFVDEETGANRTNAPVPVEPIKTEPNPVPAPKKRGRKKKILPEPPGYLSWRHVTLTFMLSWCSHSDGEPPMTMDLLPLGVDATADGQPTKRKYTKSEHYKQRRRHDRFNGMTEEEVRSRTLPDHLASNLDVVIVRRLQLPSV